MAMRWGIWVSRTLVSSVRSLDLVLGNLEKFRSSSFVLYFFVVCVGWGKGGGEQ